MKLFRPNKKACSSNEEPWKCRHYVKMSRSSMAWAWRRGQTRNTRTIKQGCRCIFIHFQSLSGICLFHFIISHRLAQDRDQPRAGVSTPHGIHTYRNLLSVTTPWGYKTQLTYSVCIWLMGGNWSTQKKPTTKWGAHANLLTVRWQH